MALNLFLLIACLAIGLTSDVFGTGDSLDLVLRNNSPIINPPQCATALNGLREFAATRRGPIPKLFDWHLRTMTPGSLSEGFLLRKLRPAIVRLAGDDLFGDLYNRILRLVEYPDGLGDFYRKYLHSFDVSTKTITTREDRRNPSVRSEEFDNGRSHTIITRSMRMNLYTPAQSMEAAMDQPFILHLGNRTTETGSVLGQEYGGTMGSDIYILFEDGKHFADFRERLKVIDTGQTNEQILAEFHQIVSEACRDGILKHALRVFKDRSVMSYGARAGVLSYFDKATWDWMKPWESPPPGTTKDLWLDSSTLRLEDGTPVSFGRVHPHGSIAAYIAAKWTHLMRATFFEPPGRAKIPGASSAAGLLPD